MKSKIRWALIFFAVLLALQAVQAQAQETWSPAAHLLNRRTAHAYLQTDCKFEETTGTVQDCQTSGSLSLTSSDREGWTAERSRCASSSTMYIDARLGTNRLLEIRCWAH